MRNPRHLRRVQTAAASLVAAIALTTAPAVMPAAAALEPSEYNPSTDNPPPAEEPDPPSDMQQSSECATSAVLPNSQFDSIPVNNVFGVDDLHRYANGDGQTVAVIDSGVTPNVRLPNLEGAGDYVLGEDGLEDCDHHGTLVAGLINAGPARDDNFIGVAPAADLLSIRQTSGAYSPRNSQDTGASTLVSLASAIRRAADEGASVINLSVTACVPAGAGVDLSTLKGALHHAAVVKDAVVVASAGNVDDTCSANPGPDPAVPSDPRGWDLAETISLPSYIDQFVLSVGGTDLDGAPYQQSLPGPWVDVAAPALSMVSLDPTAGEAGGLINAEVSGEGETVPIAGTSFASAYVSGLATLIRQRHPSLAAEEVRNRIINTAHPVADGNNHFLGQGLVDPVTALTASVDSTATPGQEITANDSRQPRDPDTALNPAAITFFSVLAAVVLAVGAVGLRAYRKRLRTTATDTTTSEGS